MVPDHAFWLLELHPGDRSCRWSDSNRRPLAYEAITISSRPEPGEGGETEICFSALPLSYICVERVVAHRQGSRTRTGDLVGPGHAFSLLNYPPEDIVQVAGLEPASD